MMVKGSILHSAGLLVLLATCGAWVSRSTECVSSSARKARLIVENETECPVSIFINDRFIVHCEPFTKQTIRSGISGKVTLIGRSRCDTWGPKIVRLIPGRTVTWRLGHSNRRGP